MRKSIDEIVSEAIEAVDEGLVLHKTNGSGPLSVALLERVKYELKTMHQQMDPKVFRPTYPKFVLDWPDDSGLVKRLVEASYEYGKLKKST